MALLDAFLGVNSLKKKIEIDDAKRKKKGGDNIFTFCFVYAFFPTNHGEVEVVYVMHTHVCGRREGKKEKTKRGRVEKRRIKRKMGKVTLSSIQASSGCREETRCNFFVCFLGEAVKSLNSKPDLYRKC